MMDAGFDVAPIRRGDDPRNDVERKDVFLSGVVAIDTEGHAHIQNHAFRRLLAFSEFPIGEGCEFSQQQRTAPSRPADPFVQLVVEFSRVVG